MKLALLMLLTVISFCIFLHYMRIEQGESFYSYEKVNGALISERLLIVDIDEGEGGSGM